MLIPSHRHKLEDLEVWKDHEAVDRIEAMSKWLCHMEKNAMDNITRFAMIGPCYIGVSWGKDSVVVCDLSIRAGLKLPMVHLLCNPSHNPECDKVRDAFLGKYPQCDYHEIDVDYLNLYAMNLAPKDQDRLTDIEWNNGFKRAVKQFGAHHISGVRGQESSVRTLRMRRWGISTQNTCAPIGYWKDKHVYAYLSKYDLPIHPNYAMLGGGRYKRDRLRVAEIGDIHGRNFGRDEWEREYYQDIINRISVRSHGRTEHES